MVEIQYLGKGDDESLKDVANNYEEVTATSVGHDLVFRDPQDQIDRVIEDTRELLADRKSETAR